MKWEKEKHPSRVRAGIMSSRGATPAGAHSGDRLWSVGFQNTPVHPTCAAATSRTDEKCARPTASQPGQGQRSPRRRLRTWHHPTYVSARF
ncbi:hypothetical protein I4F81_003157 [Pyropia yezoensis]|uniref:Uncharacterized protein n=1 Tax=Pyropia yezoensis TaxID=2788 RepID=A0ACC3BRF5_PYRYE|nr:hypothetical protein I4F81_003157 [Neopyropia yezoensis]